MADLTDEDINLAGLIASAEVHRSTRPCPPCGGDPFGDDEACRICPVCTEIYFRAGIRPDPIGRAVERDGRQP